MTPELEQEWLELTAALGVGQSDAREALADLARRYAEDTRVYHTLEHAWRVVQHVNRLALHAADLINVQLAAWFHDAIYDPRATDNEERSAAYAAGVLQQWEQPQSCIEDVQRLILLTKSHRPASSDSDGQVLVDADLAILGAPPATYARYAAAIRREYSWVSDSDYGSARVTILWQFLERPYIYFTPPMRREREQRARANLNAEIERLSQESLRGYQ